MKCNDQEKSFAVAALVICLFAPLSLLLAKPERPAASDPNTPSVAQPENQAAAAPLAAQQSGTGVATTPPSQPAGAEKKNFFIELAGTYSGFVPGAGSANWRGWESRLIYSGFKRFTPFGGAASLGSSSGGMQQSFGAGSYVTISKWLYLIGGFSYSPESKTLFVPHSRFDITGMLSVPKVKGLVFSAGLTELPAYKESGHGRIIALGDLYYWRKFVFGGSVNLNFSQPGDLHSLSGQFGAMYGTQSKYYISGGMSGGNVAYELIANVPFDVRYQTVGTFLSYSKWVVRNTGFNVRYDYQKILDGYKRHSMRIGLFHEF